MAFSVSRQVSPASMPTSPLHHVPPMPRQSQEGSCDMGTGQSNVSRPLQGKQQHARQGKCKDGTGELRLFLSLPGATDHCPCWLSPPRGCVRPADCGEARDGAD